MLDSVDARCRFRLIVPSLIINACKNLSWGHTGGRISLFLHTGYSEYMATLTCSNGLNLEWYTLCYYLIYYLIYLLFISINCGKQSGRLQVSVSCSQVVDESGCVNTDCRYRRILWLPITRKIRVAQKNVIEEKLLKIKRSIRRGIYLFQIRTGVFFQ